MMRQISKISLSLYMCLLTYVSLTPVQHESAPKVWDKAAHFSAYALMFLFVSFAFPHWKWLKSAFVCLAYSVVIEGIQFFIPNRSTESFDILANLLGISLGWCLLIFLLRIKTYVKKLISSTGAE